ncbi:MAG: response regulator transcription factor [Eggerthellaceae bacterium]
MAKDSLHNKTILLVDDEPELLNLLKTVLAADGFETVITASDVASGLSAYEQHHPDLAILDVALPDGDGFTLCTYLRSLSKGHPLPVIFLTAKDETSDRLTGLRSGADDYLTKPFSAQELILRMYAVLRRCYPEDDPVLHLAHCTIDLDNVEVHKDGCDPVFLTAKESELLRILANNANRIVTTDHLCEECWGSSFGYEQSLMTHVRRIREKIELNPSKPESLITMKGLGYKLLVKES